MKSMFLQDMNWIEVQKAIEEADGTVIIPVGSIEQHGHLPVYSDCYCAWGTAKKVAELAELDEEIRQVIILPMIPIGCIPYMANFPGVISVSHPVLQAYFQEIAESLIKHGVLKFIWIAAHSGSVPPISAMARDLKAKYGTLTIIERWWVTASQEPSLLPKQEDQHAGLMQSAITYSQLTPEQIKECQTQQKVWFTRGRTFNPWGTDNLVDARVDEGGPGLKARLKTSCSMDGKPLWVYIIGDYSEVTPFGSVGDPRAATAEYGHEILDFSARHIIQTIKEIRKIKVPLEPAPPSTDIEELPTIK